jgi:hypothetical protein
MNLTKKTEMTEKLKPCPFQWQHFFCPLCNPNDPNKISENLAAAKHLDQTDNATWFELIPTPETVQGDLKHPFKGD